MSYLCRDKEVISTLNIEKLDNIEKINKTMNDFTLLLPKRPQIHDEIAIKAKLRSRPRL